jgi:hypothetical protein
MIDAVAERVSRLKNPPSINVSFSLARKQLPAALADTLSADPPSF